MMTTPAASRGKRTLSRNAAGRRGTTGGPQEAAGELGAQWPAVIHPARGTLQPGEHRCPAARPQPPTQAHQPRRQPPGPFRPPLTWAASRPGRSAASQDLRLLPGQREGGLEPQVLQIERAQASLHAGHLCTWPRTALGLRYLQEPHAEQIRASYRPSSPWRSRDHLLFHQTFPEESFGTVKVRADRFHRDVQDLADLLVRQLVEVVQGHRGPVGLGQFCHRLPHGGPVVGARTWPGGGGPDPAREPAPRPSRGRDAAAGPADGRGRGWRRCAGARAGRAG